MELFKGQSLLEFTERFKTNLDCEEYLASLKVGRWILLSQITRYIFLGFRIYSQKEMVCEFIKRKLRVRSDSNSFL